ncbi:TetR/AcrR family transcriptional regulator [Alphaproteobacteria bacterium KMM 3653]|uniref:TetR/AcrR family transcriptional regulator n=1 Tax=Harenicola maris TaxID=2841044 RepID=A0AAP2G5N0_9RHOB|nr:TetR/AcrR family transcriptional regulator [Harenicola maris]
MTQASTSKSAPSEGTRAMILATGRGLVARHGFSAMGLSALLREAGVPKGSFYHYFASKEAFGEALLTDYVTDYLARMDAMIARETTGANRLLAFCDTWLAKGQAEGLAHTCLVVKLGAEVADLSETMRCVLDDGVAALTQRLETILEQGANDGSLIRSVHPAQTAQVLYAQWLGAAILSKLAKDQAPLIRALADTKTRLLPQ